MFSLLFIAVLVLSLGTSAAAAPVISEFMASNGTTLQDGQGNWPDWIEIHNPTAETISLAEWGISDDPDDDPWIFPDVELPPDGRQLVFASNEDRIERASQLVIEGGGRDIWDRRDSFLYHYVQLDQTNFTITARIDRFERVHPWAKAGVMIRRTLDSSSAHGSMFLTGNNGFAMQYRTSMGDYSASADGFREEGAPSWVRLVRDGNSLRGYYSHDGDKFESAGKIELPRLPESIYVGLAVSSHLERQSTTVHFGSVTIDGEPLQDAVSEPIGSRVPHSTFDGIHWELHTDFALARSGEFVGLYTPEGELADGLHFDQQYRDISYGRLPDTGGWAYFPEPNPGRANTSEPVLGFAPKPEFVEGSGGHYQEPLEVAIDVPEETTVHYTRDGSRPSADDPAYGGPIKVDETQVLRAKAFREGYGASQPVSATFVIQEDFGLPVLSIITDPEHLWDEDAGIHVHPGNRGRQWERPAEAGLIDTSGDVVFHDDGLGLRIHGGASRWVDKKSFRLYWRQQQVLETPLFPYKEDLDWIRRVVVRSGGNDHRTGHDGAGTWTMMRCALMAELWRQEGGISSSHRPVSVLLNGEFWGAYNLRERIDHYFLKANLGIDPDGVDLLKVEQPGIYVIRRGSRTHWDETLAWFEQADLSDPDQYEKAQALVDVENFTDWNLFLIYAGNWDWPQNNVYMFREHEEDARWRFIMWDVDDAFHLRAPDDHNTLEWALRDRAREDLTPPWYEEAGGDTLHTTVMLRRFMENPEYREYFQERLYELLDGTLSAEHVEAEIKQAADLVRPGIPREAERWGTPSSQWERSVERMITWAHNRPGYLRDHWQNYRRKNFGEEG